MQLADLARTQLPLPESGFSVIPHGIAMKMSSAKSWLPGMIAALWMSASGCAQHLVATPNLLQHQEPQQVYADCPPAWQSAEAVVVYATDRAPVDSAAKQPSFGIGRAASLTFGVAEVSLQPSPSWQELAENSTTPSRAAANMP